MPIQADGQDLAVQTFLYTRDSLIDAPVDITFDAVLAELGPGSEMPDGTPFPMKLEPWPGGRWFRDLGNDSGHFWGHVQVIKPPGLLELSGPMFVSFPTLNHVQYRLAAEGNGTRLKLTHRAHGLMPKEFMAGADEGWGHGLKRIGEIALRLKAERRKGAGR